MDKISIQFKFEVSNNGKKYNVEKIWDKIVYTKELEIRDHLLGFYYLILWKGYFMEENT